MTMQRSISAAVLVCSILHLPAAAAPAGCQPAALAKRYAGMLTDDQALRGRYIHILELEHAGGAFDPRDKDRLETAIAGTDEKNQASLDRLIARCGWPGALDRRRAALSAFTIIQHAPLAYRLRYGPAIEAANRRGEISNEHLAWFVDRNLVQQGKPQRYGTDIEYGSNRLSPVEDGLHVNARRKAIGLPPLEGFPL